MKKKPNLVKINRWQKFWTPARILVIGFASLILLGGILLSLPIASENGQGLPFHDALFTATSAVCVTGLIVVDTGTYFSTFGELVIISLIQVGGLGFMTVATFVLMFTGRRIGLKERLLIQESLNVSSMDGLIRLTRNVVLFTLAIEAFFAVILTIRFAQDFPLGRAIYYGAFHAVSAFCNAGFDLFGDFKSLADYVGDPAVNLSIMSLIILGGLGFTVMVDLGRKAVARKHRLSVHTKLVLIMSFALLVIGTLGYYQLEHNNPDTLAELPAEDQWLASAFASTTARTAGYASINYETMSESGQFWTVLLMFIGASPGSTGGGVKTVTTLVILLFVWTVVTNKEHTVVYRRTVSPRTIYKSLTIAVISAMTIILATMILVLTDGKEFLRLLFETTSAFATVGLSTNLTPVLSDSGQFVIMIMMFIGRLGPLTIALALAARANKQKGDVKYPDGNLYVG
ncbi:trk system potassium uptake protein TrkH [Tumebacillus sp. BK434]|uniref:TrkH family potassium uptake protein n=1 Tax=Tumebacillus sp. BK434 TaxID=2512169 RepID=UPI001049C937|nr:TrkH family potassium uptake protein [Tumebacillus sp. BK434]TCP59533.1 trk system potassium uptake protein TrkH [Tumebacillus sp. BK434]